MIDWRSQWELHSRYYHDGFLFVNLQEFGGPDRILKLEPGPGFGDLSHPTTRLTLKLLLKDLQDRVVIDVGCGSGILSLAAAAAGAKTVYGLDIEDEALAHAKTNAALNGLEIHWLRPEQMVPLKLEAIAAMNMIRSEQAIAWESLCPLHPMITTWITSGVLSEEKKTYLKEAASRGWKVITMLEEDGWMAFKYDCL